MRPLLLVLPLVLAACTEPDEVTVDGPIADPEAVAAVEPAPVADGAKLDLNTASEAEFLALPDVGENMAHEFEEYRPYISIQQFRREMAKYVEADQIAAYEQYVYVPVDPEASDAETLMQLPGVDAAEAQSLVDGRPYASRQAFLDALTPLVDEGTLPEAETYLTPGS